MPRSSKDDLPNRSALDDLLRGARMAAALKAALELDIFTRIAEGNRSLPALIRASGLNERGLRILLDALANINLLVKSAFEYALTPTSEAYLVKGKPTYYGDALLALLAWEARGQLARAVRSGKPISSLQADGGARLPMARAAATWVDWQSALQQFAPVWEQLGIGSGSNGGLRALGLGAEAGLRLLPLLQQHRRARLTVVDAGAALPPLLNVADTLQLRDRVEPLEGDWLSVPLEKDAYDVGLVDSITMYRSLEQNIGILHRAYEALVMGGRIVLRATIADDERKGPRWVPLLGLDVLMGTTDGDIYTTTEYRGMLEAAGFFEVRPVGDKPGVLTGRRIPPPPPPPPAETVAPDFIPPPETLE